MNNRDDFSRETKRIVALRASHRCSFPGCPQITAGPSDESPRNVTMIGKAAHIHAAAPGPGARRYLPSTTPEERSNISNAIWLCATHADLIDRDEVTYTADILRGMKREHEVQCAERQRNATLAGEDIPDLIALGPNTIFVGELLSVDNGEWSFHLRNFVEGDIHTLITFGERCEQTAAMDRYVIANFLGDGRVLKGPPSIIRETTGGYTVRCPVFPGAHRIPAVDLPPDIALSDKHDLILEKDGLAMVFGLEALPQLVKRCLSLQRGELMFHRDFGTRFAEYYRLLQGSMWFEHFLKLETDPASSNSLHRYHNEPAIDATSVC
jgi:hypothetical protein